MNRFFENIPNGKKVYVASDFHLGAPSPEQSLIREKKIVLWLDSITPDAHAIILAGDVFDFWFEYKHVAPKGFVRLLGKLAQMSDIGISIILFVGNHDLWIAEYLTKEIQATILYKPESFLFGKQKVMIGHGDGLGPGERRFKSLKRIFISPINKNLFSWLHPDIGLWLGKKWSDHSRNKDLKHPDPYIGKKEPLFIFCQEMEKTQAHDYYLFGHRHLSLVEKISNRATYINLGDWIQYFTYVEIDNKSVDLKKYEE